MIVVVVGAIYKDVILHIDSYPKEDTKVRARHVEERRGGNGGNTLSVLAEYYDAYLASASSSADPLPWKTTSAPRVHPLYLIASLPEYHPHTQRAVDDLLKSPSISIELSQFHSTTTEPTAWIISTPTSRTIVNHSLLDEVSFEFIKNQVETTFPPCSWSTHPAFPSQGLLAATPLWFHLEGRNITETVKLTQWLHVYKSSCIPDQVVISVECEKPDRSGIDELLPLADVCFFSKHFAESRGFPDAPTGFLDHYKRKCRDGALLLVTWGEQGAYYVLNDTSKLVTSQAVPIRDSVDILDTIGAGDVFIAGMMLSLGRYSKSSWKDHLQECVEFAVHLATIKCSQIGFQGLATSWLKKESPPHSHPDGTSSRQVSDSVSHQYPDPLSFEPPFLSNKVESMSLDEDCNSATDSAFGMEEVVPMDFMSQLPYEVAVNILRFLESVQDVVRVSLVCKQWYQLAQDNDAWRSWYRKRWARKYGYCLSPDHYTPAHRLHSRQSSTVSTSSLKSIPQRPVQLATALAPAIDTLTTRSSPIVKPNVTVPPSAGSSMSSLYSSPKGLTFNWKHLYKQRQKLHLNWKQGKYQVKTLLGHEDSVYCIQFDSQRIVSGSRDRTIKFWEWPSLKNTLTLTGHTGSVLCLQYNDKFMVSGSSDTTAIIWDFVTGKRLHRLMGHSQAVLDVRLTPQHVVTCSKDHTIRVWDVVSGDMLRVLEGHGAAVNAVHVHHDIITSASGDCVVKLWDLHTGVCLREFVGHFRGLACVQFDGQHIISGSNDKTIRIWNALTGECINTLDKHTKLVRTLCFDSEWIVSGSYDESIKVWNRHSGQLELDLVGPHKSWIFHVQQDVGRIVSASQDRQMVVWDFSEGVENMTELMMLDSLY